MKPSISRTSAAIFHGKHHLEPRAAQCRPGHSVVESTSRSYTHLIQPQTGLWCQLWHFTCFYSIKYLIWTAKLVREKKKTIDRNHFCTKFISDSEFLVWLASQLITQRGDYLWPILQPATRGVIKMFWLSFRGSSHVGHNQTQSVILFYCYQLHEQKHMQIRFREYTS